MRKFKLPEWTEGMPDHTTMGSKDIRNVFGYSQKSAIDQLIKGGYVPEPDIKVKRGPSLKAKLLWSLGSLREIHKAQRTNLTKGRH